MDKMATLTYIFSKHDRLAIEVPDGQPLMLIGSGYENE